ncbi:MAG: NADH-quinone oxidoreductase subunit L [Rhodobacteraceae bacterium]|nr:NADH-quinone oxidoreductase subunit L [Paracoccaceae bacterium]
MYQLIVFLPLLGALIAGFLHRLTGERAAQIIPTAFLMMCAVLSWIAFFDISHGHEEKVTVARWIASGAMVVDWAFRIDMLTGVMLVVVTSVSALVHLYSIGYMEEDDAKPRFFAYLSLFTFMMLMLVTADNFLQMFFGWEGVGLASYLLIGFWWKKPSANAAAIKAFVVNRVGDFGFALGVFGIFMIFGSVEFDEVFAAAPGQVGQTISFLGMQFDVLTTLTMLLFIGAMGKSAQLFLHTWLPDAMEGPTPVSALIHAATMVTAGVFLVCRCAPMFELAPDTLWFVTVIGASTAFFAATIGLVQFDIKRVIAYSTCSQLGYMFFAAGIGAYEAAMFHLFTHAFFKALLFLGAGSVIHAMHHEQDMRQYGGLLKVTPVTAWTMFIGTLAITGVGIPLTYIGFAGFLSKDIILEASYASQNTGHLYAFWVGVIAAAMTSFYSWRLWFKTFLGRYRGDPHTLSHAHESPMVMLIPLVLLAAGAMFAGMAFYGDFVGDHVSEFWREAIRPAVEQAAAHGGVVAEAAQGAADHGASDDHGGDHGGGHGPEILHAAHGVPAWVKAAPFFAMMIGLIGAVWFYIVSPWIPDALARRHTVAHDFLQKKWYFDELYDFIFVRPAMWIGNTLWKRGDGAIIDGAINGLAMGIVPAVTGAVQRAQSGYIFRYASVMIVAIAAIVTFILFGGIN